VCPSRGSGLYGGQDFGMAGGAADAGGPTADGHQVGGRRGLDDHRGALRWPWHRWIQWWLGGTTGLIGLCGRESLLLTVRRRLFAAHYYEFTFL